MYLFYVFCFCDGREGFFFFFVLDRFVALIEALIEALYFIPNQPVPPLFFLYKRGCLLLKGVVHFFIRRCSLVVSLGWCLHLKFGIHLYQSDYEYIVMCH